MYKISIITVVYNGAKTIEQTILSVLGQAYKNIEYIVVDGLSTDGTQQIVEKYIDSIAHYIREKDSGIYDAMNKGIELATGDIVGIINSDDWYETDAFGKIVNYFNHNKVDVVYGNAFSVHSDGSKSIMSAKPLESLWYQMAIPHPTVFVKRDIYSKLGKFDLRYKLAADYELMLRFNSHKVTFGYINDFISNFRVTGLSMKLLEKITEEHMSIAIKYSKYNFNQSEVLKNINQWYEKRKFCIAVENQKGMLYEILCRYFDERLQELIIFGTGIWGNRCYNALKDTDVEITSFIDNDSSKWNKMYQGIPVINPADLANKKGNILIAIENAGESIKQQLDSLGNECLKSIDLEKLVTIYGQSVI